MENYNIRNEQNDSDYEAKRLYEQLCGARYNNYPYETKDLEEDMALVNEVIMQYWKPRYLMDRRTGRAYEFMDGNEVLKTVSQDDIDWETLKGMPEKAQRRAEELCFHFPSFIYKFSNGTAMVSWQLNPDGEYYMDDDGFGMTSDREINIYGFIDRQGRVVVKFQEAESKKKRDALRIEAENIVR